MTRKTSLRKEVLDVLEKYGTIAGALKRRRGYGYAQPTMGFSRGTLKLTQEELNAIRRIKDNPVFKPKSTDKIDY